MSKSVVHCPMDRDKFHNHMRNKAEQWNAQKCEMGDDFAVFKFEYKFTKEDAELNLSHYYAYYGYNYYDTEKQIVIINTIEQET